jgi:hypothetical protein
VKGSNRRIAHERGDNFRLGSTRSEDILGDVERRVGKNALEETS